MSPFVVVYEDGAVHRIFRVSEILKARVEIKFILKNSVDSLGDSVLIAMIFICHAGHHSLVSEVLKVTVAAVLASSV